MLSKLTIIANANAHQRKMDEEDTKMGIEGKTHF
jgi:hypothetical protein